jgi:ribosomal protein L7/L12
MDALTNALNLISVLVQERNRLKTDLDDIIVTNDNTKLYARIESMEKQLAQGEDERRRLSAALAEAQRQIAAVQASAKAQTPNESDLIASAEAIAEVYSFDPGKKIAIIRDLKLARGIGLREAKEAVETVFLRR